MDSPSGSYRLFPRLFHLPAFSLDTLPFTNEELDKAGLRGEGESLSASSIASSATAPYDLSVWERTTYYNGISPDHPELLYRSDLLENPFPIPEGRHPLPSPSMESSVRGSTLSGTLSVPRSARC